MAAYLIGRMNITDPDTYAEYKKRTPEIIERYGGRFLSRGGEKITLEGEKETRRVVIVEFPSAQKAAEFYHSPDYQAALVIRKNAAQMDLMIVGGFE